MTQNKGQHFIPRAYLSAWTDPGTPTGKEPYVWVFPRDGSAAGRRRAPANIFKETDMYTVRLPDGGRDLRFEHGLSQLETGIIRIRTEFLEAQKQLPVVPHLKISAFVAAMNSRTPRFREHHRRQWQQVLDLGAEIMENMKGKSVEEKMRAASLSLPSSGPSMSMEQVKGIVDYPIQKIAPLAIEAELAFLPHMRWWVLSAPAGHSFISSDSPVVWFDPDSHRRPLMFRSPALSDEALEITMPISPRQMLMVVHDRPMSRGFKPISYVGVGESEVTELNRRTRAHADKEIVVHQNTFDERWLSEYPIGWPA